MVTPQTRPSRGARFWDRISSGSMSDWADRKSAPIHALATECLALRDGESVLDIGCGRGSYLATLRRAVGGGGRVVGIDNSPKMLRGAQATIDKAGWDNVTVRQVDFTQPLPAPEAFDAAIAVFSLSAMPGVSSAVANACQSLRLGGRLFVIDLRLEPHGLATPLIHLCRLGYKLFAGWTGVDVLDTATARFKHVTPARPYPTTTPARSWPPVTMFVATKDSAETPQT